MIEELNKEYDKLQLKYGARELHSIYNRWCINHPDICFVFMNPTGKNIASLPNWKGIYAPWLGTKTIWSLFYDLNFLDENIYLEIRKKRGSEWNEEFASLVYEDIAKHKVFITNLGKCTQIDARPLPNYVYKKYLELLYKEISIIKPKVIILFGNQVSSIVLNEKISVSTVRKKEFIREIDADEYKMYSVFYPVGNGRFNIDKAIEDIKFIMDKCTN